MRYYAFRVVPVIIFLAFGGGVAKKKMMGNRAQADVVKTEKATNGSAQQEKAAPSGRKGRR